MIDYSVYMTPNPMNEEAAPMAYGRAQMRESMTFDKFVKHIAEHNGVFSRGTVQGVILDMCEYQGHQCGFHSRSRLRGNARQGGVQSRSIAFGSGGYLESRKERLDHRRP